MRKLLIGLGVLVVLLVAAAVIIPFAVPVEVYSARVAALVKQATGRELKIAGPVRLSVLPMLASRRTMSRLPICRARARLTWWR